MSATRSHGSLQRRRIGATEIEVTSLGFGGGALGGLYDVVTADDAIASVHRAYEGGVRYFDTAPLYGHGRSEERVGRALEDIDRNSYTLSSKAGVVIAPTGGRTPADEQRYADPFLLEGGYDFTYDGAMRSLEGSLERLRTDRIDIVYIHDPDEADSCLPPEQRRQVDHLGTVMDGIYRALHELREQRVIGAIGVGLNGTEMLTRFARAGDFDAFLLAGRYTLLEQHGLEDLFPVCRERNVSLVVGGVFNSGILAAGAGDPDSTYNYVKADPDVIARVRGLEEACGRHGIRLPSAALQFPLGDPVVAAVIPGMRSVDEVDGNLRDIAQPIPAALWAELRGADLVDRRAALPPGSDPTGA